jgi:hypothetical protein
VNVAAPPPRAAAQGEQELGVTDQQRVVACGWMDTTQQILRAGDDAQVSARQDFFSGE